MLIEFGEEVKTRKKLNKLKHIGINDQKNDVRCAKFKIQNVQDVNLENNQ